MTIRLTGVPEAYKTAINKERALIIARMAAEAENGLEDKFMLFPEIFDPAFLRPSAEPGLVRGVYHYDTVREIMESCLNGSYVDPDAEIDLMVKNFGEKAPLFD